jgi:hypothetical protein
MDALLQMQTILRTFLVESVAVALCRLLHNSRTCCFLMNLRITWMLSVLWLEQHLAQYSGTVIAVTHDRYFLDNVGWILELDRGEVFLGKETTLFLVRTKSGTWHWKKSSFKRRKNLERELDWVRQGAKDVKQNKKRVCRTTINC